MDTNKIYLAVDFGSSRIKAMAAKKDVDGHLQILGCESMENTDGVKRGSVINPTKASFLAKKTIESLAKKTSAMLNQEFTAMYTALTGYSFHTEKANTIKTYDKEVELSEELIEEYEQAASQNLEIDERSELYGLLSLDYIIDGAEVAPTLGVRGFDITASYLAVIGQKGYNERLNDTVRRVMVKDAGQRFAPLTTARILTTKLDREKGCVVIDFGAETTTVVVIKNNMMHHAAVIPMGGKVITHDLTLLNMSTLSADLLKRKLGSALVDKSDRTIVNDVSTAEGEKTSVELVKANQVIQARIDEIMDLVCMEIYKSGYWDNLPQGVIITGGASKLKNLKELIKIKTGMEVRDGNYERVLTAESARLYATPENALLIGLLNDVVQDDTSEACNKEKSPEKPETPPTVTDVTGNSTVPGGKKQGSRTGKKGPLERGLEWVTGKLFDDDNQ